MSVIKLKKGILNMIKFRKPVTFVLGALVIGALLFGAFQIGQQAGVGASTQPQAEVEVVNEENQNAAPQVEGITGDDRWIIGPFTAISFDDRGWDQFGQEGGCIKYRSSPIGESDPSTVVIIQFEKELVRNYPLRGAFIQVCGSIVHLPPTDVGRKLDDD